MPCSAGRTPHAACAEPDDGSVYVQACARMHMQEVRLCRFHVLYLETARGRCTACWEADGSLVPVTITAKDTT